MSFRGVMQVKKKVTFVYSCVPFTNPLPAVHGWNFVQFFWGWGGDGLHPEPKDEQA